ncbi:DHA2 family efflux MFS transporter permease subunit [Sulfurihydrogenibium azorense]|uniref:DHA2 family efflux MFS transporter permease subunit n=1 Tax=Sulfurihydrogenibium azorense TaxID=309806 RepID=UPI002408F55B|nr:DHA2 family efflux MFS transporter permease subunit [Sulfurihydrogenibium azorense]MDM7273563.1 DHA2 family efflux MFS transporter permease subunit [Sulfurihydrogenibium azorense]
MENTKPIYERITTLERALITFIVMSGAFMAILDTTIVDVVVPKMMGPLQTDLYGIQWVITAYMIASAVMLILSEWLDKVIGLRKVYIAGVVLFTFSSFMCGQAQNLDWMITARVFQGIGEALIMATAQTILFSVYPEEKKGMAMGIFGLGVSFAPALGPTLGGYITEYLNWRWVFFINIPFGILTTILAIFYLPETSMIREKAKLNFVSYFFLSVFTISLLIFLSKGQQLGWFMSDVIVYLFIVSILSLLLYILSEILSKEPLIDFRIFLIKEYFVGFSVFFLLLGFSMYQVFYLLPLYYENLKGLSTFDAGLHILAFAMFIAIFSPVAGILSDKWNERYVLYIATAIYLISSIFILPNLDYYTPKVRAALMTIPLGIAMGMFFAPVTTLALRKLGEKTSLGTGLMHYGRFVGGSFGTAIATNDLYRHQWEHFEGINAMQNNTYVQSFIDKVKESLVSLPDQIAEAKAKALLYSVEYLHSLNFSFQDTFFIAGLFGLVGSLPVIYMFISDIIHKNSNSDKSINIKQREESYENT